MSEPGAGDGTANRDKRLSAREIAITWTRVMVAGLVVSVILAVSGGFGSDTMAILPRLAFWLALTTAGVTLGVIAAGVLVPRSWFDDRRWVAGGLVVATLSLPMTGLVVLGNHVVSHRPLSLGYAWDVFPSTLLTTAAMTALAMLMRRREPAQTHAAALGAPPPKFLDRLPARLAGADLWAVEAEDHYLRLHTSLGQDLILMRLSDAVTELEGIEGARTHRSWWVARAAVTGVERADGRATLTLIDGAQAPVSRAYAKALREAGWL